MSHASPVDASRWARAANQAVVRVFSFPVVLILEESTLRKIWVARCLAANDKAGSLADLERRFSVIDKDFADCFSIVDGVPVYCRGERDLYNKKQGCKYLTFQWYIMFDGCPLAVTGPYPGSMHDSEAVRGSNPFPHKSLEWI